MNVLPRDLQMPIEKGCNPSRVVFGGFGKTTVLPSQLPVSARDNGRSYRVIDQFKSAPVSYLHNVAPFRRAST